ncbi:hypothetical protein [Ureaplasma parvum]|uniref:hypothetical protein n=1 Tax=Ureaplasma parvum TaxID=134821 RepID=UPI0021B46A93|nr:hypothetical protein [Ureaplasma parvum]
MGEIFYHLKSESNTFRIPEGSETRKITEISIKEMFDLIKQILKNTNNNILKNNLFNTILKLLSLSKNENNISNLNSLFEHLKNVKLITIEQKNKNEYIILN